METQKTKAVFLDRDGVINRLRAGYVRSVGELEILPGAAASVARLSRAGWLTIVVTNQAGVAKGMMSDVALEEIHEHVDREVKSAGGKLTATYFCPHRNEDGCGCRKPLPGMLLQAARELGVDLSASFLVGDTDRDIGAGEAAGCKAILVGKKRWEGAPAPMMEVRDLDEAASWILANGQ